MINDSAGGTAPLGKHALVLGASVAGLLAARVLSEFYTTVTVVERDELDDADVNRRGVPQGRHIHGLLMRGALAMDELLPGLLDELADNGASVFDGTDLSRLHFCMNGHLAVRRGSSRQIRVYNCTRPFLELHIRRRVRAIPNVVVLDRCDVVDYCVGKSRVTGARVRDRDGGAESALSADLVVDATGRGSPYAGIASPIRLRTAQCRRGGGALDASPVSC